MGIFFLHFVYSFSPFKTLIIRFRSKLKLCIHFSKLLKSLISIFSMGLPHSAVRRRNIFPIAEYHFIFLSNPWFGVQNWFLKRSRIFLIKKKEVTSMVSRVRYEVKISNKIEVEIWRSSPGWSWGWEMKGKNQNILRVKNQGGHLDGLEGEGCSEVAPSTVASN